MEESNLPAADQKIVYAAFGVPPTEECAPQRAWSTIRLTGGGCV